MQIGDYSLGQNVSDQPQLTEISQLEYNALPKTFVGEKILRAPDTLFLGHLWNIRIGAIKDRIYKLSAQFDSDNDNAVDTAYSKAIDFCTTQYGAPFLNKGGKVIGWDTPFGNIIVDRGSMLGSYYANFQVTSGSLVRESRLLTPRITTTRMIVGFFLSAVSAYSFSFSIDLILGGLFAIYPETAFLPTVTWSLIATIALVFALKVSLSRIWLSIPFLLFGALALFGAFVGTHPHSYGVAAGMFIFAALIWGSIRRTSKRGI